MPEALPSPMPSLPPPAAKAPGETPATMPWFGSYDIQRQGFTAHIAQDGSISFSDRQFGSMAFIDPVRGIAPYVNLDVTDAFMRMLGEDPYLSDKLAVLDATRGERIAIRKAHNEEMMHRALADLPSYLNAVWTYPHWSGSIRRQILFELWDEAAEDGNDLVREGGAQARLVIARFIAFKLPPGTPDAFSDEELMAFNRDRTSVEQFDPYSEIEDAGPEPDTLLAGGVEIRRIVASF